VLWSVENRLAEVKFVMEAASLEFKNFFGCVKESVGVLLILLLHGICLAVPECQGYDGRVASMFCISSAVQWPWVASSEVC
jgi:hypothetical protein